jgi:hypothetical protein
MNHRHLFVCLIAVSFTMLACSDDDSDGGVRPCADVCKEAQAGACTAVKGECGAFCAAMENVAPAAKCEDQRSTYLSCLSGGPVCDQNCDNAENALIQCATPYCMANATNEDCKVLIASF